MTRDESYYMGVQNAISTFPIEQIIDIRNYLANKPWLDDDSRSRMAFYNAEIARRIMIHE